MKEPVAELRDYYKVSVRLLGYPADFKHMLSVCAQYEMQGAENINEDWQVVALSRSPQLVSEHFKERPFDKEAKDCHERGVLHYLAMGGCEKCFQRFVDENPTVELNVKDRDGNNPLNFATNTKNDALVKFLEGKGLRIENLSPRSRGPR